jgi:hypothetical protein
MGHPDSPVGPIDQELVSESTINKMFDMDRIKKLAKMTVPSKKSVQQEVAAPTRRNNRLDEKVNGESTTPHHQRRQIDNAFQEEDPFESKMREIEGRRSRLGL